MRRLTRPLLIVLAIAFLIEAWLWNHLEPLVEWIVERLPLRALKRSIAGFVRKLPPTAALVVFVVPLAALFPLKLVGFWLLAQKQWIAASVVFVLAKLVGVAITAFVFHAARPKLLQLRWFRWLYDHVLLVLAWSHQLVAPLRRRVKRLMRLIRTKRVGRALRLFWRIRSHVRRVRDSETRAFRTDAPRAARAAPAP
jgi:hypothetical protein